MRPLKGRYIDKTRAAEAMVAQLTDQLLTLLHTARSGFDEGMEKETQRLR